MHVASNAPGSKMITSFMPLILMLTVLGERLMTCLVSPRNGSSRSKHSPIGARLEIDIQ